MMSTNSERRGKHEGRGGRIGLVRGYCRLLRHIAPVLSVVVEFVQKAGYGRNKKSRRPRAKIGVGIPFRVKEDVGHSQPYLSDLIMDKSEPLEIVTIVIFANEC
jgi:hypothetical protein